MKHELEYLGHSIVVQDPEEPGSTEQVMAQARDEADESLEPSQHSESEGDQPGDHGGHGHPIIVTIDGQDYLAHHLRTGYFHTHELPFIQFETIDKLARAIVHSLEARGHHGRPQEPGEAHER